MPGFDYSKFDHIDFSDSEEEADYQMLLEEVTTLRRRVKILEKEKKAWKEKTLEKIVISKRTEYIIVDVASAKSPLPTADEMTKQAADAAQMAAGQDACAFGPAHLQPPPGNSITGAAPATVAQVMAALEAFGTAFGTAIDDTFVKKQVDAADDAKSAAVDENDDFDEDGGPTQKQSEKKTQLDIVERISLFFAVKLFACLKSLFFPVIGLAVGGGMMLLAPTDATAMVGKLILYFEAQSFINIFMSWPSCAAVSESVRGRCTRDVMARLGGSSGAGVSVRMSAGDLSHG